MVTNLNGRGGGGAGNVLAILKGGGGVFLTRVLEYLTILEGGPQEVSPLA